MPHITLLYPFRPPPDFDAVTPELARACAGLEPFAITLAALDSFAHGRERFTIWAAPHPAEPLVRLHAALTAAVPDCDDTSRVGQGFTPHLSLGQARGWEALDELLRELRAGWAAIPFTLTVIAIIRREEDTPFVVDREIPLGAGGRP
jgi:2'-5' RNA ligase